MVPPDIVVLAPSNAGIPVVPDKILLLILTFGVGLNSTAKPAEVPEQPLLFVTTTVYVPRLFAV